uniref:Uncharacterized protein n=1 Tax=viral metagenome TaxID=1070528 RepID=A0A6C0BLX3_9ZZZZ
MELILLLLEIYGLLRSSGRMMNSTILNDLEVWRD